MFSKISYTLKEVQEEAVWPGVIEKESQWAHPEEGSIKMNLEEVYKDYGRFKKRASLLKQWVKKEFAPEKQYKEYVDQICSSFPEETPWEEEIESIITEYE